MSAFDVSGLLYKKRGGFGGYGLNPWQLRFFAATKEGLLYYFDDEANATAHSQPRGRLDLREGVEYAIGSALEGSPTEFTIMIANAQDRWRMCAESKEELNKWQTLLTRFCDKRPVDLLRNVASSPVSQGVVTPAIRRPSSTKLKQVKTKAPARGKSKKAKLISRENLEKAGVLAVLNLSMLIVAHAYDLTLVVILIICNVMVVRLMFKSSNHPPIIVVDTSSTNGSVPKAELSPSDAVVSTNSLRISSTAAGVSYAEINGELVPVAGCTCQRAPEGETPEHSWTNGDASVFSVRTVGYKKHKQKAPSAAALMDLVAVDFVRTKYNISNIGSEVVLPDTSDIQTNNEHVPPLFIVSWQLPTDPPPIFNTVTDGPGCHAVYYFKLKPEVCEELKNLETARPAVKLFVDYCREAKDDPTWRGRFKTMAYVHDLDKMGFPSFIPAYNAKPVLIRNTGTIVRGRNYIEMDINVHTFANVAKRGLSYLMPSFKDMHINVGYVIEGRADEELPECLFGAAMLHKPDYDKSIDVYQQPDLQG